MTFPIPPESAELLDFYIKHCLPLLNKHGETWLFPGAKPCSHKSRDQFSRQFSKTIRRLTGLEMNMHLMRHLGAKLYLDQNPGAYEVMRRVLGHKRMSTTVNNYTGLETDAAIRHFDAVILGIRNDILKDTADDTSK
jgi:integrase